MQMCPLPVTPLLPTPNTPKPKTCRVRTPNPESRTPGPDSRSPDRTSGRPRSREPGTLHYADAAIDQVLQLVAVRGRHQGRFERDQPLLIQRRPRLIHLTMS